eukprot:10057411-Alexandrium_andersonii.AAC.1
MQGPPAEKVQASSASLGKFFSAEVADYKKEAAARLPDHDGLTQPALEKRMEPTLKQAQNCYNVSYRSSGKFLLDLPAEKVQASAAILG